MLSNLEFCKIIKKYQKKYHRSPTYRELMSLTSYKSTSAVAHRIDVLEKLGMIERDRKLSRSIRVVVVHHKVKKVSKNKSLDHRNPRYPKVRPGVLGQIVQN